MNSFTCVFLIRRSALDVPVASSCSMLCSMTEQTRDVHRKMHKSEVNEVRDLRLLSKVRQKVNFESFGHL